MENHKKHLITVTSLIISGMALASCSGIELADNRFDAFNADIVCVGGECPDGIISGEIAALINERRERIARKEAAAGQPATQDRGTPVTVREIQEISRKPEDQKTDRDREIEELLEELLQQRRDRIAREGS